MCEIINTLNSIDTDFFLFLNGFHNSFLDPIAFLFSNKWVWIPLYASILFIIIKHWKKDALWIIIAFVLSIVLADQIASGIFKPMVKRLRPSHVIELQSLIHTVNGYVGGKYGFVSSHAANSFALALFSSLIFKRNLYSFCIFLWAILNSYTRIYLGVHYPFDILGGAIVGLSSALFCYYLLKKLHPLIVESHKNIYRPKSQSCKEGLNSNLTLIILAVTVIGIILLSL